MPELTLDPTRPAFLASDDFIARMHEASVMTAWINIADTREVVQTARQAYLPNLGGLAIRSSSELRRSSSDYYEVISSLNGPFTVSDSSVHIRDIRDAAREQQRAVLYVAGGRPDGERMRNAIHRAAYMQRGPYTLNNGQWFSLFGGGGFATGLHVFFNATELGGYLPAAVTGVAAASLLLEPIWPYGQRYFDNQKIGDRRPIEFIYT